jgi:endoglucanase
MEIAWNLGNSLDVPEGETNWGNPVTSAALIEAVAAEGFDMVRIPVTWALRMGPGPGYIIESTWMNRVEEVVNYVLDAGMKAIINLHHDGADEYDGVEWIRLTDSGGNVTQSNNDQVRTRFVAVWAQIAEYFKDYGSDLMFESMNEIKVGYNEPSTTAYYDIINDLNQAFVDTVRATGSNNAGRVLVVPGYNTNITYTVAGFEMPQDTVTDRLILTVHFYDPWTFALTAATQVWGAAYPQSDDWGQEDWVISQFDLLHSTYINNGIPVILGEYGATNIAGYENYRRYYMEYVTKAAYDRDIIPVYWDNGGMGSGEENFGLFNRNNNTVAHPAIIEAMMRAVNSSYSLNDIVAP